MAVDSLFTGIEHSEQYLARLNARLAFRYERETGSILPELSLTSTGHIAREAKAIEEALKRELTAQKFVLSVAAAELLSKTLEVCTEEFKRGGEGFRQSSSFRFIRFASEVESLQSFVVDVCRDIEADAPQLAARVDALYLVAQESYAGLTSFLVQTVAREGGEIVGLTGLLGVVEMALLIQNQVLGEGNLAGAETITDLLGID